MLEILLTQGLVALVDDADFHRLSIYKWFAVRGHNTFYAVRNRASPKRGLICMHHEVVGKPVHGFQTDHIDGNGLNNQRVNLREATAGQNQMNQRVTVGSSMYKGVSWHSTGKKWRARIHTNGRDEYLGFFSSEEDAARVYDSAASNYFGEFARLNFPVGN